MQLQDESGSFFSTVLEKYDGKPSIEISQYRSTTLALWSRFGLTDLDLLKTAAYYFSQNLLRDFNKIVDDFNPKINKDSLWMAFNSILKLDGNLYRINALAEEIRKDAELSYDHFKALPPKAHANRIYRIKQLNEIINILQEFFDRENLGIDTSDWSDTDKKTFDTHLLRIRTNFKQFNDYVRPTTMAAENAFTKLISNSREHLPTKKIVE